MDIGKHSWGEVYFILCVYWRCWIQPNLISLHGLPLPRPSQAHAHIVASFLLKKNLGWKEYWQTMTLPYMVMEWKNYSIAHEQLLPGKYRACIHDKEWHSGGIPQHSEEKKDVHVPNGQSKPDLSPGLPVTLEMTYAGHYTEQIGPFSWPSSDTRDDICWALYRANRTFPLAFQWH